MKERSDFTRCYASGRRCFSINFVVFVLERAEAGNPWRFGSAVTKKTGTAVVRNRIRRLLRECVRLYQHDIPQGYDFVIIPKKQSKPRLFTLELICQEILPLLRSLHARTGQEGRQ